MPPHQGGGGSIVNDGSPEMTPSPDIPLSVGKTPVKVCRRCEGKERSEFPRNARTRDRLSSWCSQCHAEAKRGYRREQRVERLLAEADEFDRLAAAATGGRAGSFRFSAEAVRRQAARESRS